MARTTRKKKTKKEVADPRPRWRVLPPEIIRMILQDLVEDKIALRKCSQISHDFRYPAQSLLGRHLTVNSVGRLKESAPMIAGGAFQHIRSLDLGVTEMRVVLEEYWKAYLPILVAFGQYHSLNRLWLSEVPFNFAKPRQKKSLREAVVNLGSTITELGLYGCHFSSYEEIVSFVRSFPACTFLFVRDCVTGKHPTGENTLAGLPEHQLSVKDLQLSSPSWNDLFIDVSNLIQDAALDVGSLTSLMCDVGTFERTQRVAAAVSKSPVEHFQVACTEPGGFQAFMEYLPNKWPLKSLTIGPQPNETDLAFWEEAFKNLPPLPGVDNVTLLYNYPGIWAFNTAFWSYFNRTLTRKDLFPALKSVKIQSTCGSRRLSHKRWWAIHNCLSTVRSRGLGPHYYRPTH